MAHARVLKTLTSSGQPCDVKALAAWVQETGASAKELKAKIRKGQGGRRGRTRKFGRVSNGELRVYPFKLGPQSAKEDRAEALAFLHESIRAIERMNRQSALRDENRIGVSSDE